MSRVVILIRAGIVQCVHMCLISMNMFVCACLEGLGVVDVGCEGRDRPWQCPVRVKEDSEVSAQLKQTRSTLRPLTRDGAALYQEHTLPGIPFKNIFNR